MYSTHCAAGHIDVDNGLSYLKAERKYALSCGTGDRRINDGWFLATAATNDAVNLSFDIVRAHVMNEYEYVCMFPWHRVGIEDRCQHKLEGAECTQLREDPKEFILVDLPPPQLCPPPTSVLSLLLKKKKDGIPELFHHSYSYVQSDLRLRKPCIPNQPLHCFRQAPSQHVESNPLAEHDGQQQWDLLSVDGRAKSFAARVRACVCARA